MKKIITLIATLLFISSSFLGAQNNQEKKGLVIKPFPLLAYDADTGLGYGVSVTFFGYENGSKDYKWKVYSEYYATTGGELEPDIEFDIRNISLLGFSFTLLGKVEYKRALFENYYGYGSSDSEINYNSTSADNYYYNYKKINPYLYATLATPIWKQGTTSSLNFFVGLFIDHYEFHYSEPEIGQQPAKIFDTNPLGVTGGTVLSLLGGFIFDTRDFSPNPHAGSYNEIVFESAVAGDYNYSRLTLKHSSYWQPFNTDKLVIAERIIVDQLFGDAPFFKAEMIGGTQRSYAMGGKDNLRGMPRFRFLNNFKAIISPEIRWNFIDLGHFLGDDWHLELVLFSDIGGTWDKPADFKSNEIQIGYGVGLRVFWGKDFAIAFDFGFWQDENGLYVGFDQQF